MNKCKPTCVSLHHYAHIYEPMQTYMCEPTSLRAHFGTNANLYMCEATSLRARACSPVPPFSSLIWFPFSYVDQSWFCSNWHTTPDMGGVGGRGGGMGGGEGGGVGHVPIKRKDQNILIFSVKKCLKLRIKCRLFWCLADDATKKGNHVFLCTYRNENVLVKRVWISQPMAVLKLP